MNNREVDVSDDYHCPMCRDHEDDIFYQSRVLGQPICQGCSIELSDLIFEPGRPDDPTVDAIEIVLSKPWHEIRIHLLKEDRDSWRGLGPNDLREMGPPGLEWSMAEAREYVQRQIEAAEEALANAQ